MAVTTTSVITNTIDSINNQSKALAFAMPFMPYALFGQGDQVAERKGTQIRWYRHTTASEVTATLAENPTWAPASHSVDTVSASMSFYGNGREITELLEAQSVFDLRPDLLVWAGEEAGKSINAVTRNTLTAGVTTIALPNSHTSATFTSADTPTLANLLTAVKSLKEKDAPAFDFGQGPCYVAVISPNVERYLLQDTNFQNAIRVAAADRLFKGYIGMVDGTCFVRTSTTSLTTVTGITADQTLIFGRGAYGVPSLPLLGKAGEVPAATGPTLNTDDLMAYGDQLTKMFRLLVTQPGDGNGNGAHGDEWATRFKVAWKAMWTCKILNQDFIINWRTAQ